MTDRQITDQTRSEDDAGEATEQQENISRQKKADPFADAFEAAERELDPKAKKPAKRAKPKAKDDAETDEEAGGKEAAVKTAAKSEKPKTDAKAGKADEAADEDDDDADEKPAVKSPDRSAAKAKDGEKDVKAKPAKAAKTDETADANDDDEEEAEEPAAKTEKAEAKKPLQPKAYWSKERREAFAYQPRAVQEGWLAEAPVPLNNWSQTQKDRFAKLPADAQEMLLEQAQEFDRGYGDKFQALAGERKLIEGIKAAIPANVRTVMQQQGMDEVGVFNWLMGRFLKIEQDPHGEVARIIATKKLDPQRLFPQAGNGGEGGQQNTQPAAPQQPDLRSHPVVGALAAEVSTLKQELQAQRQQREQEEDRRRSEELSQALSDTDEAGNPRYPLIRPLSSAMAQIIASDPERFSSMGVKEQIAEAYKLALAQFPELAAPAPKPKPTPAPKADEPEEDEDGEEEKAAEEAERLRKASTKKSKTPQSAPTTGGDPFAKAFARAERQLGHR